MMTNFSPLCEETIITFGFIRRNSVDKTIGNIRLEAKMKIERTLYEKWTKHINEQSTKFMVMFSKSNDLHYKNAETSNMELDNIFYNADFFKKNTSIPYDRAMNLKRKKDDVEEVSGLEMVEIE